MPRHRSGTFLAPDRCELAIKAEFYSKFPLCGETLIGALVVLVAPKFRCLIRHKPFFALCGETTRRFLGVWKFTYKNAIYQAASLSEWIGALSFFDGHTVIDNQWIVAVSAPLLVKRHHTEAPAISNDVANPARVRWARSTATFSSRY
jgi:hypothetical protein